MRSHIRRRAEREFDLEHVVSRFARIARWPEPDALLRHVQAQIVASLHAGTDEQRMAAFFLSLACSLCGVALDDRLTAYATIVDVDGQTFFAALTDILEHPDAAWRVVDVRVSVTPRRAAEITFRDTLNGPIARRVQFVEPKNRNANTAARIEAIFPGPLIHQLALDVRDAHATGEIVPE